MKLTTALLLTCVVLACGIMAAAQRGSPSRSATSTTTSSRTTPSTTTASQDADDEVDGGDDEVYRPYSGDRFDNFDWKLCKMVERREAGNLVISPIGVKLVLAMLYEGSLDVTAQQIRNTLELPVKRSEVRKIFKTVLTSLKASRTEYEMDVGTKLYIDESITPRQKYSNILKDTYSSCIEPIDFSKPTQAAEKINSWVDAVTKGHIQNLVSSGDKSMASTVMLLVNAIFFKGLWRRPFNPEHTSPGRFTAASGRHVTASYMRITDKFYIHESEELRAKILRLPYQGKKYSMFVVLPDSPTGLNALLQRVTPDALRKYMWDMVEGNVEVVLPKFSFQFTAQLTEVLKEMGIQQLFTNEASLSGIVDRGRQPAGFKVSEVLQKAGLEVGEKGTTAYAATSVSFISKFGEEDYVFNATHPFMFYIEDETTGTVIFVGKVVDPSKMDTVNSQPFQPIPSSSPEIVVPSRRPTRPTVRPSGPTAVQNVRRPFEDADVRRPVAAAVQTTTVPTRNRIDDRNISALWADLFSDRDT